jgi:prepilin peptidase CpaA
LLAAIGALLPPNRGPNGLQFYGLEAEMYSFFAAGLIAPAFLAYEGKLFRTIKNTALLALNPLLPSKRRRQIEPTLLTWFRFGPAIFVGTALTAYLNWRR